MPVPKRYACKQCGAVKEKADQWWTVCRVLTVSGYVFMICEMKFPPARDEEVLCGAACAQNELAQFLADPR